MPAPKGADREDRSGREDIVQSEQDEKRRVILFVEDTDADRDLYGSLLWYNGYDLVHAADGESAIQKALELSPDLILLDIKLSGQLSGLDVARSLREAGLRVPMIAISALSREEVEEAARAAGVSLYLEKPIDPFAVVKEVMRHVGRARPATET